jgi:hypothetical protein
MADDTQVADLRRLTGETGSSTYDDEELKARIDAANGDLDAVAADIWEEKAAAFAELVDISEAGSSRKNSSMYKAALEMHNHFTGEDEASSAAGASTTRPIVRA